jgi:hypothetical protein
MIIIIITIIIINIYVNVNIFPSFLKRVPQNSSSLRKITKNTTSVIHKSQDFFIIFSKMVVTKSPISSYSTTSTEPSPSSRPPVWKRIASFRLEKEGRILTRDWEQYDSLNAVYHPSLVSSEELERVENSFLFPLHL